VAGAPTNGDAPATRSLPVLLGPLSRTARGAHSGREAEEGEHGRNDADGQRGLGGSGCLGLGLG